MLQDRTLRAYLPATSRQKWVKSSKRRRREKATPEMAVRYADSPRPQHRKREASETRCAQTADASLSVSGTGDAAPSTGIYCNGNGNRRCAELQATSTVAARNVKSNRNGRCAGKDTCSARMKPLPGRRLLTASMLTGVVGAGAGSPTFEAAMVADR